MTDEQRREGEEWDRRDRERARREEETVAIRVTARSSQVGGAVALPAGVDIEAVEPEFENGGASGELALLREVCGVPPGVRLYRRPDGAVAFAVVDERGMADGAVPEHAVVDYLARRVVELQDLMGQVNARRRGALEIIERQRDEIRRLRDRLRDVNELLGGRGGDRA